MQLANRDEIGTKIMKPHSRRSFVAGSAAVLCATLTPRLSGVRASDEEKQGAELLTPAAMTAIDKGLALLASRQDEDGSFGSGGYSRNVAVCGLCGMAFMSPAPSTPARIARSLSGMPSFSYMASNSGSTSARLLGAGALGAA